ncbi:YafY family protein [Paenibacillus hodogayensis]|uniref:YafY family protein n=1 Tax=Paenibacillus hodogayensis TaxID=279208 RepID=A0ABV5VWJ5_9BACL
MRADRLLSILLLLQTYKRMTAAELAERLEVSERTIHRDMEALGAAGVPVTAERGTGGGWRLMDDYRTNLTGLHDEEIASLFLAAPEKALSDLGLRQASEAALIKLLATLPGIGRRTAEFVRERIHIDASGWRGTDDAPETLPLLQEAVFQERRVRLVYRRTGAEPSERLVDPLGLVMKGVVWYLVAAVAGDAAEVRTYRLARIVGCELTEESSARPPGFSLAAYWEASMERFVAHLPRFEATFRLDAEGVYFLNMWKFASVLEQGEADESGRASYRIRFQTEEEACRLALAVGGNGELIEPAELRGLIAGRAAQTATLYKESR